MMETEDLFDIVWAVFVRFAALFQCIPCLCAHSVYLLIRLTAHSFYLLTVLICSVFTLLICPSGRGSKGMGELLVGNWWGGHTFQPLWSYLSKFKTYPFRNPPHPQASLITVVNMTRSTIIFLSPRSIVFSPFFIALEVFNSIWTKKSRKKSSKSNSLPFFRIQRQSILILINSVLNVNRI